MSSRYAHRSDPLYGRSNTPEPPQQPAQSHTQPAKGWDDVDLYNPHSKRGIIANKAANIVRQRYRIPSGMEGLRRWQPHHDAEARRLFDLLMEGEPLPDEYRTTAKAPERRDPATDPRNPANWRRHRLGG